MNCLLITNTLKLSYLIISYLCTILIILIIALLYFLLYYATLLLFLYTFQFVIKFNFVQFIRRLINCILMRISMRIAVSRPFSELLRVYKYCYLNGYRYNIHSYVHFTNCDILFIINCTRYFVSCIRRALCF